MNKNFKLKVPPVHLYGKIYTLALGGIHSVDNDQPSIYRSSDEMMLLDKDVTSFYPVSLINYDNCPKHIDKGAFKDCLRIMFDQRREFKKKKKELFYNALQYGLKIGLNTLSGLFAFPYFFLFDLLCTYRTTINNQLFILTLIEDLGLEGIEVISANTDGVLMYFPRWRLDEVQQICKNWEKKYNFELEDTEIDLYVRKDVNNYIAVKTNGEVKVKGLFIPSGAEVEPIYKFADVEKSENGNYRFFQSLLSGYTVPPIVSIALLKYYIDGVDVTLTIENHTNIYDFCISQKTGKDFKNYVEYVKRTITRNKPSKKKRILIRERYEIDPVYEEYTEEKIVKGVKRVITKRKKIKNKEIIPAEYDYIEVSGGEYTHPKIKDEILDRKEVQKTIRFYVTCPSLDEEGNLLGDTLKKEKIDENGKLMRREYCAKQFIKIFNIYEHYDNFDEYNVNYDYYISSARKFINQIEKNNSNGIIIRSDVPVDDEI